MTDAFEVWAPREIKRLREEADVLQLALDRFVGAQGGPQRKPRPAPMSNAQSGEGQGRRSKYEPLFVAWAEASREHPINYGEMGRLAREAGVEMNQNLLRSTLHSQKQLGRVRPEGDGYVWLMPTEGVPAEAMKELTETEAAPSD